MSTTPPAPKTSGAVLIADDHPLFRGAMREAVSGLFDAVEVLEAGTLEATLEILSRRDDIDLVLLDLKMPGVSGFSGLTHLRAEHPAMPVVVVSAAAEPATARYCLEFGAAGFIPKTTPIDQIRAALATILQGGTYVPADVAGAPADAETADLVRRLASLTPQQMRVLAMVSEGLLNKQIAYELGVSEATVKAHVSAILTKLGVDSRTQAVIAAAKLQVGEG